MKKIIIGFLTLLAAVWLGVIMYHNPGYVLISCHNWSFETSLWFAIIILLIAFLLFYLLLRFTSGVKSIALRIRQWISNRRKRKAYTQTVLGLYDFVEGNWSVSEKKLLRAAKYSDMPLISYLAAAFMAQRQLAFDRRDNYLLLAQQVEFKRPIAVGLSQARLQIFNQQWEEALATLQHLHQLQPKNVFILQLLQQTCLALKDWVALKILLPLLRKYKALNSEEINKLELQIYTELLITSIQKDAADITWKEIPRYLRKKPELIAIYAKYLLAVNKIQETESILKIGLHQNLNGKLLELYTILPSTDPIKKIARAEKWLKTNPENGDLLLCLGRICQQQKLWGKARQYLEKSAYLAPTPTVYAELAKIMESQNKLKEAIEFYHKGLKLVI